MDMGNGDALGFREVKERSLLGDGQQFDIQGGQIGHAVAPPLPARLRRRKEHVAPAGASGGYNQIGNAYGTGKLSLKHGLEPGL